MGMPALFEGKQLDLIRRTVASDTTPAEFEQFIHICRAVNLDPLRRQIFTCSSPCCLAVSALFRPVSPP